MNNNSSRTSKENMAGGLKSSGFHSELIFKPNIAQFIKIIRCYEHHTSYHNFFRFYQWLDVKIEPHPIILSLYYPLIFLKHRAVWMCAYWITYIVVSAHNLNFDSVFNFFFEVSTPKFKNEVLFLYIFITAYNCRKCE